MRLRRNGGAKFANIFVKNAKILFLTNGNVFFIERNFFAKGKMLAAFQTKKYSKRVVGNALAILFLREREIKKRNTVLLWTFSPFCGILVQTIISKRNRTAQTEGKVWQKQFCPQPRV